MELAYIVVFCSGGSEEEWDVFQFDTKWLVMILNYPVTKENQYSAPLLELLWSKHKSSEAKWVVKYLESY